MKNEATLRCELQLTFVIKDNNMTINFGSFLCMDVAYVKEDYNDLSCDLPIQSLTALNADFDG